MHSGAYDRASYALTLSLVALASDMEVHMLLTFEGLRRFTEEHFSEIGEATSESIREQLKQGLEWGIVPTLESQLTEAKKLGLKLYACPNAIASLSIPQNDIMNEVDDVMGVAAFLKLARSAAINWYI